MAAEKLFFQYSCFIFERLILWKKFGKKLSVIDKTLRIMMVVVGYSGLCAFCITQAMHNIYENHLTLSLIEFYYCYVIICCLHKTIHVIIFAADIQYCISITSELSKRFIRQNAIIRSHQEYNRIFLAGLTLTNIAAVSFILAPLTLLPHRTLPLEGKLFYDIRKSPYWELTYIYQTIVLIYFSNVLIAFDTLFCGLMSICSGFLEALNESFQMEDNDDDEIEIQSLDDQFLISFIVNYRDIFNLIKKISDVFALTSLIHMSYNCLTITFSLFLVSTLTNKDFIYISMTFLLFLSLFQLGIYCYYGQKIINQRDLLQRNLYFSNWCEQSRNNKFMTLITMQRLQNERFVEAASFLPLSFETLLEVLKKAYGYFAFLHNVNAE